jgi:hypothetical protein
MLIGIRKLIRERDAVRVHPTKEINAIQATAIIRSMVRITGR